MEKQRQMVKERTETDRERQRLQHLADLWSESTGHPQLWLLIFTSQLATYACHPFSVLFVVSSPLFSNFLSCNRSPLSLCLLFYLPMCLCFLISGCTDFKLDPFPTFCGIRLSLTRLDPRLVLVHLVDQCDFPQ